MVVKAVWPNYIIIIFFFLIFNVQVETFEDFGSSGITECTSITDSQNRFPYISIHGPQKWLITAGWSRRQDNKLAPHSPLI